MQLFSNRKSSFVTTGVKAALILMGATLLPVSVSHAVPFTSDISISGSTDFAESPSFGSTSGDFGVTVGGVTTTSTYAGSTVTGADPLFGTLTDIGDGFGFTGSASTSTLNDEFLIGIDTNLTLGNSSATDTYEVVFGITFSNLANADGDDAYSHSNLELLIGANIEFFSDLLSDPLGGDLIDGEYIDPATFGDLLSEAGSLLLPTITLTPGAGETLELTWTGEGGVYFDPSLAELDLSTFLSVASVTNVTRPTNDIPEPGTFFLLGAGLLGLPLLRKARRG